MADSYIEVNQENFAEKVLQAPQLVVVNFSKENSSACSIQEPEFAAISKEYQDKAMFAKITVTGQESITNTWKIEGVPTLLFIKGGNELYRISGIVMRNRLRRQIEGILLAN